MGWFTSSGAGPVVTTASAQKQAKDTLKNLGTKKTPKQTKSSPAKTAKSWFN